MPKFIFVISPKTHLLDLAGPDQVIAESRFFQAPFEVEHCTFAEGGEATTASGLHFSKLKNYAEIEVVAGDYIFIPGMDIEILDGSKRSAMGGLFHWLSKAYTNGANLCSVCTGAFVLAAGGFLDDKICTTHWKYTQLLAQRFPKIRVQENVLFTERDRIFTSAGIASGVDLALHIVEKEMGGHFAHKVAREIVVYTRREGNQSQQSVFLSHRNHIHAGIHSVQDWLFENLDKKTSLASLAELANMSPRNFTRIFKKETSITLGEYLEMLRRERIGELLKKPDLSRSQIARQVGLASERHLSRLLKKGGAARTGSAMP